MKVAVFGASGFVGAALVERLTRETGMDVVICINRLGNAWRFSRARIPVRSVDIMSSDQLVSVLDGVTHVVNCTRGGTGVMFQGLSNLLTACREARVKRFVHLSSISVYGNPPPGDRMREDSPTNPEPGSYGWEKLRQDGMVEAAHDAGLDCVVLCPPNISGIYSSFVYNVLSEMRSDTLALVDGGNRPNSTVDVENLVHAILLSLNIAKGDGKRMFVTDGNGHTWKEMTNGLMELAQRSLPLANVAAENVVTPVATRAPLPSFWRSVKHLASSEVREALRRDPRWARADAAVRQLVAKSGAKIEDRLRMSIEGPQRISKVAEQSRYSSRYMAVQKRGIWHDSDRARDAIGYAPVLSLPASFARYAEWYRRMYGFGESFWPLANVIETFRAD